MQIIYKGKHVKAPENGASQMFWGMFKLLIIVAAALKGVLSGQLSYNFDAEDDIPYDVYPIENE